VGETLFNSGNSYGPETTSVQFAVDSVDGAVGTFFNGARRINRIRFKNIEGVAVDLEIQENSNLGATGWVIVGSGVTVQPGGGEAEIDVTGLIEQPFARIFGGPTVTGAGTAIVRAEITDTDLIDHFRQNKPYGAG
jgi:hypothetical protein